MPETSTTTSPTSDTSSSSPRRPRRAAAPGFRAPAPPSPEEVAGARERLAAPAGSASDSPSASALDSAPSLPAPLPELDEPKPAPSPSSPASSTDRKAIERAVAAAVAGMGNLANTAATTDEQQDAGLYLVDEQDEQAIAKPVASLLARNAGVGILSPNLSDIVAAAVAVAVYASKQLQTLRDLRRARTAGLLPTDHTPHEENAA